LRGGEVDNKTGEMCPPRERGDEIGKNKSDTLRHIQAKSLMEWPGIMGESLAGKYAGHKKPELKFIRKNLRLGTKGKFGSFYGGSSNTRLQGKGKGDVSKRGRENSPDRGDGRGGREVRTKKERKKKN